MDDLRDHLPANGSITVESLTNTHTILVVAGPKSRDVAHRRRTAYRLVQGRVPMAHGEAGDDRRRCSHGYGGLVFRRTGVGIARSECAVATGFRYIEYGGSGFGMAPFGALATESMRLEKDFRHWKADLLTSSTPMSPVSTGSSGRVTIISERLHWQNSEQVHRRQSFVMMSLDADHATPMRGFDPPRRSDRRHGHISRSRGAGPA